MDVRPVLDVADLVGVEVDLPPADGILRSLRRRDIEEQVVRVNLPAVQRIKTDRVEVRREKKEDTKQ